MDNTVTAFQLLPRVRFSLVSVKSFLTLTSLFLCCNSQAQPSPCVPEQLMEVNGITYMGPAKNVTQKLGPPINTKTFKFKSAGNSGTYSLKRLTYKGATFTVRSSTESENLVERWTLTAPQFSMGGKLHVGLHKKEVGAILGIDDDIDVPSLKEARLIYAGKQTKISSSKSDWALGSCTLHAETTFVELYFSNTQHLSKIVVFYDDGAI